MSDLVSAGIDPKKNAFIYDELDIVSRRLRVFDAVNATALAAAAGVLYVTVLVIADHSADGGLSLGLRRGLLICVGGLLAAMAIRAVFQPLVRTVNQRYAARLIERRFPKLHNS